MIESSIVKRVHELALTASKKNIAIDATVGNGYDTLFLAEHFEKVIGIDIQNLAIKRSKEKTKNLKNVELYLDDFNNIANYKYANVIIFNLGFLPGSNRKIKTQDYTSNKAILKAYSILDGIMLIACYIQHDGGLNEYKTLLETLNDNNIKYDVEDNFERKEILIVIKNNG
jgi:methylase of polypeptide subunit release factors